MVEAMCEKDEPLEQCLKRYVAGFMFSIDKSLVLLVEKRNPAWQRDLLNGIGGKIEAGEHPIEAMIREFAEETGVETSAEEWTEFVHYVCQDVYEIHFYRAFTDKIHSAVTMEKEVILKLKSDCLPKNVIPNLNWLIPLSLDENVSFASPIRIQTYQNA